MFVLDNESRMHSRIIYDNGKYEVLNEDNVKEKINGIGVFSEYKDLIGLVMVEEKLYFIYNDKVTRIFTRKFKMSDESRSGRFLAVNDGEVLCDISYKPYVSPEIIIGEDIDEFDDLCNFANEFGKNLTIHGFKDYLSFINKE